MTEPIPQSPLEAKARALAGRIEQFEFDDVAGERAAHQEVGRMLTVASLLRAGGLNHAGTVLTERMVRDTGAWARMLTGDGFEDGMGR